MRILVADDDAGDAAATLRALAESGLGVEAHWVKDGEEALAFLLSSEAPALVLLDIGMPKVDGIELLRRMKGSDLRAIPAVVMTSSKEERDVLASYHLGVAGYLLKPVTVERFRALAAALGVASGG